MRQQPPGYRTLLKAFRAEANPAIAEHSARFFKTGKGEYGEGDRFLGIRVPVVRKYAAKYRHLRLSDVKKLLRSRFHEERLLAVILMVEQFKRGAEETQQTIYRTYLENTEFINNWDIVDGSAHFIVGGWLFERDRSILDTLAASRMLWERRIAIMATYHFIRKDDFADTLRLSDLLLNDEEDLIHKAVGWMLREVGNRDKIVEQHFLKSRYHKMPRTMLRYAIEKFPEPERQGYLRGEV